MASSFSILLTTSEFQLCIEVLVFTSSSWRCFTRNWELVVLFLFHSKRALLQALSLEWVLDMGVPLKYPYKEFSINSRTLGLSTKQESKKNSFLALGIIKERLINKGLWSDPMPLSVQPPPDETYWAKKGLLGSNQVIPECAGYYPFCCSMYKPCPWDLYQLGPRSW